MLEKNPELNQPEQELVADDAVKTFRKIIQKKHTEETQETEERASVFSYAATACLALAVLTVGVQFYQNYNHKSITDTITEAVSRTANSTEVTKAERQTEKKISYANFRVEKRSDSDSSVSSGNRNTASNINGC